MPLLLVLLGGMMWVGDLVYCRQRLVVADRFVAWNAANRYRNVNLTEGAQAFFPETARNQVSTKQVLDSKAKWWVLSRGGSVMDYRMPDLARGLLSALVVLGGSAMDEGHVGQLRGRPELAQQQYLGHTVLMRSGAYTGARGYDNSSLNYSLVRDQAGDDSGVEALAGL